MLAASDASRSIAPALDLRLSEVVSGLSCALDITEGQRPGHAARSCLIGMRIADEIGLSAVDRSHLYYALLLKDLGCSSNAARFAAIFAADDQELKANIKVVDWSKAYQAYAYVVRNVAPGQFWFRRVWQLLSVMARGPEGAREVVVTRCERGADIARRIGFEPPVVEAIRALDEHWDGHGQPYGLRRQTIPLLGRILGLAQTVEVFASSENVRVALDLAFSRRGSWFDPGLVDALWSTRNDAEFWQTLQGDPLPHVAALEPADRILRIDDEGLDAVVSAFAEVVDAKSPWTYQHSAGVARVADHMAGTLGLSSHARRQLSRAALLHDLGKLGVSSLILDKPGKLTDQEFSAMRRHPAATLEILNRVGCFREIAGLAAAHHERLDGRGYHLGLSASDIALGSRILCVADIADALTMSRPYREGLPPERVLSILSAQTGSAVDPACVEALEIMFRAQAAPAVDAAPAATLVPALAEDFIQAA